MKLFISLSTKNDWLHKRVVNPKTKRKVYVASLPERLREKYRPKHEEHTKIKQALHKVWHLVSEPFVLAWKVATNKKYRSEVAHHLSSAFKKECHETKHMAQTLVKMARGHEVAADDKNKAAHQFADIAKVGLLSSLLGHVAAGGIAKLVATLASPVDEVAGVMIDKPLRAATKRVFGKEHGILPSSFYEDHGNPPSESTDYSLTEEEKQELDRAITKFVNALSATSIEDPIQKY